MVRRRGHYEIQVLGKQLSCPFCESMVFRHREVYIDISTFDTEPFGEKPRERLTLQSFTCKDCGNMQQFQEQTEGTETNIVYMKVAE